MSGGEQPRRAAAEIIFDGVDITEQLRGCFLSMSYTDNEEDEADDLQIKLADRDGRWIGSWIGEALDAPGFAMRARIVCTNWIGGAKDIALDCGSFELDAVTAEGPPSAVTLKGTSLPYGQSARDVLKSRAWETCSLSSVAGRIASEAGMGFMYDSASDPRYDRLEQLRTTDIAFLQRLCRDAGISLKATDNTLVLFEQAAYESKPAALEIRRGDGSYEKWQLRTGETGTKYDSCRVSYTDPETGRRIEGIAYAEGTGSEGGGKQLEVAARVASVAEAESLAESNLRLRNKRGSEAQITMPGSPGLVAGVTVSLADWGPWSGNCIVSQARHSLDGRGGYVTQLKLRRAMEA